MTSDNDPLSATVIPVSEQSLNAAVTVLEGLHFHVQEIVGGSLVITASRHVFSTAFDYAVAVDDDQHAVFLVAGDAISELTQDRLPKALADVCSAVELHKSPDFGPDNFR